ncbi:unnamed protein product, partial [Mesorhabditis belari]|uniref:Hydrophobin n=1 Tax=Mesorhabditis belari TaxID=2138241 RepID=A0AAF3FJZ2_9BILA
MFHSLILSIIAILGFCGAQFPSIQNQNGMQPCTGLLQCGLGRICCVPFQLPTLTIPAQTQQQIGVCQSLYCPIGQVPIVAL